MLTCSCLRDQRCAPAVTDAVRQRRSHVAATNADQVFDQVFVVLKVARTQMQCLSVESRYVGKISSAGIVRVASCKAFTLTGSAPSPPPQSAGCCCKQAKSIDIRNNRKAGLQNSYACHLKISTCWSVAVQYGTCMWAYLGRALSNQSAPQCILLRALCTVTYAVSR